MDEGLDYLIKKLCKDIYTKRCFYKKQNNLLQEIQKVIMSSSYGKTIQKTITDETKYIDGEEVEEFFNKNCNLAIKDTQLADSPLHQVNYNEASVKQFRFLLICVRMLSMNK